MVTLSREQERALRYLRDQSGLTIAPGWCFRVQDLGADGATRQAILGLARIGLLDRGPHGSLRFTLTTQVALAALPPPSCWREECVELVDAGTCAAGHAQPP